MREEEDRLLVTLALIVKWSTADRCKNNQEVEDAALRIKKIPSIVCCPPLYLWATKPLQSTNGSEATNCG